MSDQLDVALAAWLGDRLGDRVTVAFHGAVPTGNSNVTMPFTASWVEGGAERTDLVLRMQVPDNQIFLDADVGREFRVLDALSGLGSVPVPTPRWLETDTSVLGHPFFVMDAVAGTVPTGSPSIHAAGWLAERSPGELGSAWDSALVAVASVASVDWQTHLPFLADGVNGTTLATRMAHVGDWYRWSVGDREYPTTDAALGVAAGRAPGRDREAGALLG